MTSPVMPAQQHPADYVGCPYCAVPIDVGDFVPWTPRSNLVTAECECGRTVTMARSTLERRTHSAD
jgi:hypothetical protein